MSVNVLEEGLSPVDVSAEGRDPLTQARRHLRCEYPGASRAARNRPEGSNRSLEAAAPPAVPPLALGGP